MIKRFFGAFALLCALAGVAHAQNTTTFGNIVSQGTPCGSSNCVYYQLPPGTPWVSVAVTGTWVGTLETAVTSAPNANYSNLSSLTWSPVATNSANGAWTVATVGSTFLRVRATSWTSGSARIGMDSTVASGFVNPVFPGALTGSGVIATSGGSPSNCFATDGSIQACSGGGTPDNITVAAAPPSAPVPDALSATQQVQRAGLTRLTNFTGTLGTSFNATANLVYHFLGNSLVQLDVNTAQNFSPGGLVDSILKGAPYRVPTTASCDSSGNCTLVVNNSDGMFQVGVPFTPTFNITFGGGCLADTQYPTSVTATSVTFSTVQGTNAGPWPGQCPVIASTAYTSPMIPSFVKHGLNGATLAAWMASGSTRYGLNGAVAGIQADIAAGRFPAVVAADAFIFTNSYRQSNMTIEAFEAQAASALFTLEHTGATGPDNVYRSLQQFPVVIETGTPYAALWTIGGTASGAASDSAGTFIAGQTQYICSPGGPQNSPGTCSNPNAPPAATSGAISAGQNTVSFNYCDPGLWPGYKVPPVDFYKSDASGLSKDGTPIMVQLDTSGSGVQEWVQVQAIAPAAGAGVSGFPACSLTFTTVHAHSAGFQAVTGNNTATQVMSSVRKLVAADLAALYPNIQVIDNTTQLGNQVNGPNGQIVNQLHGGYFFSHRPTFRYYENVITSGDAAPPTPLFTTQDEQMLRNSYSSKFDQAFSPLAASLSRLQSGSIYSFGWYSKACEDDDYFYTVAQYNGFISAGSGFVRLASNNSFSSTQGLVEMQNGDVFDNFYTGCSTPSAIAGTAFFSSGGIAIAYAGGPNFNTAGPNGAPATGPILIKRPRFVSSVASTFSLAHPYAVQTNIKATVATGSTTNTLILNLDTTQPNGDINTICPNISMQSGDYVAVGNAAQTAFQLGSGTLSGAATTCTWTDTSGTNYSTFLNMPVNVFGMNRTPDRTFTNLGAVNLNALTANVAEGVNTTGSPIPTLTTVTLGLPTGGNLSNGTYCYEIAYLKIGKSPAQDGIAIGTSPGTPFCLTLTAGTSAQTVSLRYPAPPPGYTTNVYGRTLGSLLLLDNSGTTGNYTDLGFITPGGASPATVDRGITSNNLFSFTNPAASGYRPTSVNSTSGQVSWNPSAQGIAALTSGVSGTISTSVACTPGSSCVYKFTNCGASGAAIGTYAATSITAGTSFTITSLTATNTTATGDNSSVCWGIN